MGTSIQLKAWATEEEYMEAFMLRVSVEPNTGCWLWTGSSQGPRYGAFYYRGKFHASHRWAYSKLRGEINPELVLDHLCRTPFCVNPQHLEQVTQKENCRRYAATITHCLRGHPFTDDNVYIDPNKGRRKCRECIRILNRKYRTKDWKERNGSANT